MAQVVLVELSPKAHQNLLLMLQKTQLMGSEVPAYLEVLQALQQGKVATMPQPTAKQAEQSVSMPEVAEAE